MPEMSDSLIFNVAGAKVEGRISADIEGDSVYVTDKSVKTHHD